MIVVADSSPVRYLILIEEIPLLPSLFGVIILPPAVLRELTQPATPGAVREWMNRLPDWVTVRPPQWPLPEFPPTLGQGEREAIALAEELAADVLLADDEAARLESTRRKIPVQGTLGVLDLAAQHGLLVDLPVALLKLRATNFRASQSLFDHFLQKHASRTKAKRSE
jgi:predicted nucleic acid-binding protein